MKSSFTAALFVAPHCMFHLLSNSKNIDINITDNGAKEL